MTSSPGANRNWRAGTTTDPNVLATQRSDCFPDLNSGMSPVCVRDARHIPNGGQKMPSKLYVGNLAYSVSNSDLEELFSKIGQVQSVAVIMDKFTGQSKGFGFVEMTNAEDAAKAIEQFNDTELKGRSIKVNEAKPRESSFGGGNLSGAYRSGGHSHGGDRR